MLDFVLTGSLHLALWVVIALDNDFRTVAQLVFYELLPWNFLHTLVAL